MIAEPRWAVSAAVVYDADVAGADESSAGLQKWRAAAGGEVVARTIAIGPGDFFGAAHADFVGAVGAFAAFAQLTKRK